jgi:hypothetical protein
MTEGHKNEGKKRRTGQNVEKLKTSTGNNVECKKRRMGHNVLFILHTFIDFFHIRIVQYTMSLRRIS